MDEDFLERPFPAYEGDKPYIFVSYAHKDRKIVFPEIERFHNNGYPIWYDDGLVPGQEWDDEIAEALMGSSLLVVFISKNSMASNNVQDEIKLALEEEIDVTPIYLEDTKLPPGIKLRLSNKHAIFKHTLSDSDYIRDCLKAFKKAEIPKIEIEKVDKVSQKNKAYLDMLNSKRFEISKKFKLNNPNEIMLDDALKYDVLYPNFNFQSISEYLDDFFNNFELYDDYVNGHCYKYILKSAIDVFLDNNNYDNAFEVYKIFFYIYQITSEDKSVREDIKERYSPYDILNGENDIFEFIKIIKEYWEENNDKSDKQKNLFIHSVNVFIMGLAIYSQNINYRKAFEEHVLSSPYEKYYWIRNEFSPEEFLYRWGITSLMHDIYYPLEMIDSRGEDSIYSKFNSIHPTALGNIVQLEPYNFTDTYTSKYATSRFLNLHDSINLLAHQLAIDLRLKRNNVEMLIRELHDLYTFTKNAEFREHGLFSALLILNSYSYQIQICHKNYDFFFFPILDSATAILLHNYYNKALQNEELFNLEPLNVESHPIAYLLILCDNILEFYKEPETIVDNEVNEILDMQVNDKKLNVVYDIKSNSYGFGFSNELNLDNILTISGIFKEGLHVDINYNNLMANNKTFNDLSNNLPMNLLEKIASGIHMQVNGEISYEEIPAEFEDLPSDLKMNAIGRAMLIPKILDALGYGIVSITDEREGCLEFSEDEIIAMARLEHEYWCQEKIGQGWTYGEEKDIVNMVTPYLVPWKDLDSKTQQSCIDSVKYIPDILDCASLKIIKK